MPPFARTYSSVTIHAAKLLGKRIQLGRKSRGMTEAELAERCGISRSTVRSIEAGSPKVEIGLFFEAAVVVGVQLYTEEDVELVASIQRIDDRIALLPARVRAKSAH